MKLTYFKRFVFTWQRKQLLGLEATHSIGKPDRAQTIAYLLTVLAFFFVFLLYLSKSNHIFHLLLLN